MSRLDAWKTTVLLKAKKRIEAAVREEEDDLRRRTKKKKTRERAYTKGRARARVCVSNGATSTTGIKRRLARACESETIRMNQSNRIESNRIDASTARRRTRRAISASSPVPPVSPSPPASSRFSNSNSRRSRRRISPPVLGRRRHAHGVGARLRHRANQFPDGDVSSSPVVMSNTYGVPRNTSPKRSRTNRRARARSSRRLAATSSSSSRVRAGLAANADEGGAYAYSNASRARFGST